MGLWAKQMQLLAKDWEISNSKIWVLPQDPSHSVDKPEKTHATQNQ